MTVRRLPKLEDPEEAFKREQREMIATKKIQLKRPQKKRG